MNRSRLRLLVAFISSALASFTFAGSFAEWQQRDQAAWDQFTKVRSSRAADSPGRNLLQVPPGERILFVKKRIVYGVPMGDLYCMAPDGTDVRRVTAFTDEGFTADLPELSSDGTKLVFVANYLPWRSAFFRDAWMADLETGAFTRITGDERPGPSATPATLNITVNAPQELIKKPIRVSFKGCTDYYTAHGGGSVAAQVPGNEKIWVKAEYISGQGSLRQVELPAGGTGDVTLDIAEGTFEVHYATPSPDGSQMAVSTCIAGKNPYWNVSMWDVATKRATLEHVGVLKEGGDGGGVISPDGRWLVYCPGQAAKTSLGLLSMAQLATNPKILHQTPLLGANMCMAPSWAPDSRHLLFVYGTTDAVTYAIFNLYRVDIGGSAPVQLTNFGGGGAWAGKASYSPDGESIAFTYTRVNAQGKLVEDLYIMPAEGGEPKALTDDGVSVNPCWGIVRTGGH